jgi:hypothetical protein
VPIKLNPYLDEHRITKSKTIQKASPRRRRGVGEGAGEADVLSFQILKKGLLKTMFSSKKNKIGRIIIISNKIKITIC